MTMIAFKQLHDQEKPVFVDPRQIAAVRHHRYEFGLESIPVTMIYLKNSNIFFQVQGSVEEVRKKVEGALENFNSGG